MMGRRLVHHLRSERGTTLVEVIAAAIILVVIAGAVTSLLSNAQQQSGQSRVRAVAGDLAQSQLEQLRAQRFSDLVGLDETVADIQAGGVTFDVERKAEWDMQGASGASGCTVAAKAAEALRVRVSVTWDSNTRNPVRLDTLVAAPPGTAPDRGNYIVQINRRDGTGVAGLTVSLNGASALTGTTDANGCVRFNHLLAGTYTVSFQRTNWVNVLHESAISDSVTVVAGETGNKTFEYDHGIGFNVGFRKRIATGPGYTEAAVPGLKFENQGLAVDGVLNTTNPPNTSGTESKPMFPHSSQYVVKADTCPGTTSLGGVPVVTPGTLDPPRTYFYLPQMRLQVSNLTSNEFASMGIDKRTLRMKVQSPCGTFLTPAAGLGGTPNPVDVWTSDVLAVPPGAMRSVCVLAYRNVAPGTGWVYARTTNPLTLALTTDETDDTGKLFRYRIEFDLNIPNPMVPVATAEATCPAL